MHIQNKYNLIINEIENELVDVFHRIDEIACYNTEKVLTAFKNTKVSQRHFMPSTGYGYDDVSRDTLERVFSDIMKTEATILRPQICSGTHALSLCLFGLLRPGDELLSASGSPYDTLQTVIGYNKNVYGSICELGISYSEVELIDNKYLDHINILNAIKPNTKLVMVQRSRGYSTRRALLPREIGELIKKIREINNNSIIMIDNCYGEFVCKEEPSEIGADIIVGSLIKNPGGGIAPTGGYISGKKELIEKIATRLTAPGLGLELGSYEASYRLYYQGLFLAPHIVAQALKTACLLSQVFSKMNIHTTPSPFEERSDIVQILQLESADAVKSFCKAVQASSPIDSYVSPEPWSMPGYDDEVIMASGSFVSGSSIEISADAPMRYPFNVYFQGGITYEHGKLTIIKIMESLENEGII